MQTRQISMGIFHLYTTEHGPNTFWHGSVSALTYCQLKKNGNYFFQDVNPKEDISEAFYMPI